MIQRWLKFNTVGAIGIVVQLGALALLNSVLGIGYLVATAVAVEIAVLHNFVWHERWTWRGSGAGVAGRLVRFHLSNGLISIAANLLLMRLFVGSIGLPPVIGNLASIAVASLGNFLASEFFVFRVKRGAFSRFVLR